MAPLKAKKSYPHFYEYPPLSNGDIADLCGRLNSA
jgi:hypothetical protein